MISKVDLSSYKAPFLLLYSISCYPTQSSLLSHSNSFLWYICLLLQIFTVSSKKSTNFQLLFRFVQGVTAISLVLALCLVVAFTDLSVADLFASILAFIPTGWAILSVSSSNWSLFYLLKYILFVHEAELFSLKS